MNKRTKELEAQCWEHRAHCPSWFNSAKFAKLIVQECIDKMLNTDDRVYMDREGWDIGGPDHSAWTRGVLDSVEVVKKHFGVK